MHIQENIPLKNYTTLQIGGTADFFIEATSLEEIKAALTFAKDKGIPSMIIGGGSNLLISDEGFRGLIIKNSLIGITQTDTMISVEAGTPLQELVDYTIAHNLNGLQKLTGIPGTVGGAIYGAAGAYGQSVTDHLQQVSVFDGNQILTLDKTDCQFGYRDSNFKRDKHLIILSGLFGPFSPATTPTNLEEEANQILQTRLAKYPVGIKCPGSFFKNIVAENLSPKALEKVNPFITYGKIPAGTLIDQAGGKGDQLGQIKIADNHGNTFINLGGGTAKDFYSLAEKYYQKVADQFGVKLEPEVQLINLPPFSYNEK